MGGCGLGCMPRHACQPGLRAACRSPSLQTTHTALPPALLLRSLLPSRRVGTLPEQREGDKVDYRPLLHRDGSVLSVVYPKDLQQEE